MSILGTRVIRTEDPRLLTAGGVYVDDLRTPELNGAARVTFVRSPVAHARITGIDASEALAEPGVIAVLTVADMDDLAPPPPSSGEWDGSPAPLGGPWAEPLLAIDTVRFVGEPVAVVITDSRYQGEDAADLVAVDYDPLPVVLGPTAAVAGETLLFPAAGTNIAGFSGDGGPANKAQLNQPHSIALDRLDNVFICDIVNNRIRRIDPTTGTISTYAGTGARTPAPEEGGLADTSLPGPRSIDVAPDGKMYLVLREGNKLFVIDPTSGKLKHLAGTGELGYAGDGGQALAAKFGAPGNALNGPKGIAYSPDGSLYVADTENHVVRKINLQSGIVSTVVGTGERGDGPDGDPLKCKLARPHGLYLAGRTLYIGDSENHRIRVLQ